MAVSINGWDVLDNPEWSDPRLETKPIPGVPNRKLTLRREVLPLFLALAAEYHQKIAPLDVGEFDDWSYSYRPARGSSAWSNHSSGTAVDLNASAEGALGTSTASWWKKAKRNVKAWQLRRKFEIVNWGGWTDYADDPSTSEVEGWGAQWSDPMHWELKKGTTVADVRRIIKKLGIQPDGTIKAPGTPEAPTPKPPTPQPPTNPVPVGKGPEWLIAFLDYVGCPENMTRAWWTIAMRESGGDPGLVYNPSGAAINWASDKAPFFDTGLLQINNRHLSAVRKMFGSRATMQKMQEPLSCWKYAQTLDWLDWGLAISKDGKSYKFDWSRYPAEWVAKYAAASEAGFKQWWDTYPKYAGGPTKPTPPSIVPSVKTADVQPGKKNNFVLVVQQALVAEGIPLDYAGGPGTFGPKTREAYATWQARFGLSGTAATGAPGIETLTMLANKTKLFTVTG